MSEDQDSKVRLAVLETKVQNLENNVDEVKLDVKDIKETVRIHREEGLQYKNETERLISEGISISKSTKAWSIGLITGISFVFGLIQFIIHLGLI